MAASGSGLGTLPSPPPAAGQPPDLLPVLFQAVDDMRVANMCTAAAITWLAFDILLTFPKEVTLVWKASWSLPKVLYLIVRYYTLLSLSFVLVVMTNAHVTAPAWLWFFTYNGTLLTAILGDGVFLMRLYASYQQNTPVVVFICALYAVEVVLGVTAGTIISKDIRVMMRPPGVPLSGCLLTPPNHFKLAVASWSTAVAVTCIYFLLIVNKFAYNVTLWKGSAGTIRISELRKISPLVYSFLRDSALYFLMVFAGNLMNLLFAIFLNGRALETMSSIWLAAIYAISASRLTLNTRQSVNRRQLGPYWIGNLGNGVQSSDEMELYARTTFATSAPPSPVCVQPPTPDTEFSPLSPMTDARFALQQARRGPSRSYTQSPSLSPPPGAVGRRSRGSLSSIAVLARSTFETGRSSRMSRMSPDPELIYVAPWIIFEREEPAK